MSVFTFFRALAVFAGDLGVGDIAKPFVSVWILKEADTEMRI